MMENKFKEFIIAGTYMSVTLQDGGLQKFFVACSKIQNTLITGDHVHTIEIAAVEQLKADLRMSDLNRQSLWVDSLKLVDENAALKSKLKIAITCINDIFNKSKDQSHIEQLSRQALKEIGGEI